MRKPREIRGDKVKRDAPAYRIVSRFLSLRHFCDVTGYKPGTVYGWLTSGLIPADRQAHILFSAGAIGLALDPADFVPAPESAHVE